MIFYMTRDEKWKEVEKLLSKARMDLIDMDLILTETEDIIRKTSKLCSIHQTPSKLIHHTTQILV